ncbi:hypothetical protein SNEBB_010156 [Seison nebaliae]|nr:hypothetical protein SNEBB_010156 [Seison nebaliae]
MIMMSIKIYTIVFFIDAIHSQSFYEQSISISPHFLHTKIGNLRPLKIDYQWTGSSLFSLRTNLTSYAYYNIQYAHVSYRFMPPKQFLKKWQNMENWNKIHLMNKMGKECPTSLNYDKHETNEDCLNLNIYTPWMKTEDVTSKNLLPVLLIVNGDKRNSSETYQNNPSFFAAVNKVVTVTINYRTDVLGFASLENDFMQGNYGMLDVFSSLLWIRQHVSDFFGDIHRITILGDYDGSAVISALLLSPLFRTLRNDHPLLRQAILNNGNILSPLYHTALPGELWTVKLGNALNCTETHHKPNLPKFMKCIKKKGNLPALLKSSKELREQFRNYIQPFGILSSNGNYVIKNLDKYIRSELSSMKNNERSNATLSIPKINIMFGWDTQSSRHHIPELKMSNYSEIFQELQDLLEINFPETYTMSKFQKIKKSYFTKSKGDVERIGRNEYHLQSFRNFLDDFYMHWPQLLYINTFVLQQHKDYGSINPINYKSNIFNYLNNVTSSQTLTQLLLGECLYRSNDSSIKRHCSKRIQRTSFQVQAYFSNFMHTGNPNQATSNNQELYKFIKRYRWWGYSNLDDYKFKSDRRFSLVFTENNPEVRYNLFQNRFQRLAPTVMEAPKLESRENKLWKLDDVAVRRLRVNNYSFNSSDKSSIIKNNKPYERLKNDLYNLYFDEFGEKLRKMNIKELKRLSVFFPPPLIMPPIPPTSITTTISSQIHHIRTITTTKSKISFTEIVGKKLNKNNVENEKEFEDKNKHQMINKIQRLMFILIITGSLLLLINMMICFLFIKRRRNQKNRTEKQNVKSSRWSGSTSADPQSMSLKSKNGELSSTSSIEREKLLNKSENFRKKPFNSSPLTSQSSQLETRDTKVSVTSYSSTDERSFSTGTDNSQIRMDNVKSRKRVKGNNRNGKCPIEGNDENDDTDNTHCKMKNKNNRQNKQSKRYMAIGNNVSIDHSTEGQQYDTALYLQPYGAQGKKQGNRSCLIDRQFPNNTDNQHSSIHYQSSRSNNMIRNVSRTKDNHHAHRETVQNEVPEKNYEFYHYQHDSRLNKNDYRSVATLDRNDCDQNHLSYISMSYSHLFNLPQVTNVFEEDIV